MKKEVKSVKKTTGKKNFYLPILSELERTTNLTKIKNKLGISRQNLNYYLRQLAKRGLIISKGNGWYEVVKSVKKTTKYGNLFVKDSVRGHAYTWNVELPKKIEGWEKRIEILEKKNINFILVGALKNTPRIKALGRKVWLCNNHLRIFDKQKQSYYGKTAKESREMAHFELLRVLRVLENKLGFLFKPLKYTRKKEHYALIKNDLAIDQNRKGIIMRISDQEGEWLLIDDSLEEGGELENIGKKSFQTNIPMQGWWNDHKENNFKVTPTFILNTMQGIQQNQLVYSENMVSHVKAIQKIGSGVEKQNKLFTEIRDALKELKK